MSEKEILVYDIISVPENSIYHLSMEQIVNFYKNERIILYDSSNDGRTPVVINKDDLLPEIKLCDLSSTQLTEETWKKIKNETGE